MEVRVVDFSKAPSGRFPADGPDNGETFRDKFLVPALRANDEVVVILDGAAGYPSSFLDEAFGGLIKRAGMTLDVLRKKLKIVTSDAELRRYIASAWGHIERATPA